MATQETAEIKELEDAIAQAQEETNVVPMKPQETDKEARGRDWSQGAYSHTVFDYSAPAGVTLEDIECANFWTGVHNGVSVGDEIRTIAKDQSFYARHLVVYRAGPMVGLYRLQYETMEIQQKPDFDNGYGVEFDGTTWRVFHKESGNVIREGLKSRGDAYIALDDHLRALSR